MYNPELFSKTYEESKEKFISRLSYIKSIWPAVKLNSYKITDNDENLTTDVFAADANSIKENLIIITTGLHGIEGYVGAAMLNLFINKYLIYLNPDTTGILLVHGINPWGMKYKRRTNENNVDLNRNFIWDWSSLNKNINKNYEKINKFLNPDISYGNRKVENIGFIFCLIRALFKIGIKEFKNTPILGEYEFPKGIYYGGKFYEKSTEIMINLYKAKIKEYDRIIHIDIHTGYGPKDQMSIVNSTLEKRNSKELKKRFNYPLIQKASKEEFYKIEGDMIDYLYKLIQNEYSKKHFYSTTFEFGTYGDSLWASIKSLRSIINENRLHWYDCKKNKYRKMILDEYLELFYPQSEEWRKKAIEDFTQALEGILNSEIEDFKL